MTFTKTLTLSALLIALGNFTQSSFAAGSNQDGEEWRVAHHAIRGAFHDQEPEPEPQPEPQHQEEEPAHNPAIERFFEEAPNLDEEEVADEQHAAHGAFHDEEPEPEAEPEHDPAMFIPFAELPDEARDQLAGMQHFLQAFLPAPVPPAPPLPLIGTRPHHFPPAQHPVASPASVAGRGIEEPTLAANLRQIRAAFHKPRADEGSEDDWDTAEDPALAASLRQIRGAFHGHSSDEESEDEWDTAENPAPAAPSRQIKQNLLHRITEGQITKAPEIAAFLESIRERAPEASEASSDEESEDDWANE